MPRTVRKYHSGFGQYALYIVMRGYAWEELDNVGKRMGYEFQRAAYTGQPVPTVEHNHIMHVVGISVQFKRVITMY